MSERVATPCRRNAPQPCKSQCSENSPYCGPSEKLGEDSLIAVIETPRVRVPGRMNATVGNDAKNFH